MADIASIVPDVTPIGAHVLAVVVDVALIFPEVAFVGLDVGALLGGIGLIAGFQVLLHLPAIFGDVGLIVVDVGLIFANVAPILANIAAVGAAVALIAMNVAGILADIAAIVCLVGSIVTSCCGLSKTHQTQAQNAAENHQHEFRYALSHEIFSSPIQVIITFAGVNPGQRKSCATLDIKYLEAFQGLAGENAT